MRSKQIVLTVCFAAIVGSSAFLDDLLESRPVRGPDLLLAVLLATLGAIALLAVMRVADGRRHHAKASLQRGHEVRELRDLNEEMHIASVDVLSIALDFRDQYTSAHSSYVVELARLVGEQLGAKDELLVELELAARLHDIGKLGVPDAILHKPGPLTDEEWEVIRMHPIWGEQIVRRVPRLERIARIIRAEHEQWDGGGYPDGIAGEEIPLASRVILSCDAYHAMTSDRPYRKALGHDDAIAELRGNAGGQFDPRVVAALVDTFAMALPRRARPAASPSF